MCNADSAHIVRRQLKFVKRRTGHVLSTSHHHSQMKCYSSMIQALEVPHLDMCGIVMKAL